MTRATDPFVLYHLVYPGVLELGGRVSPGSVRDQFIRGVLAVDGLIGAGLLQAGESLLVVGAGIAGVSAAIRASARDISVSLVDKEQAPLSLLSRNKSRIVSPTVYDWPSRHWQDTQFSGAFLYEEGTPAEVCSNLLKALEEEEYRKDSPLRRYSKVEWLQMSDPSRSGPPWRCDFKACGPDAVPAALRKKPFDVVLFCSGLGGPGEQSLVWKDHRELFPFFTFWSNDPWPERTQSTSFIPPVSPQAHGETAQVVIIGAGDGGIQDLIRFLTGGLCVRKLLEAVRASVGSEDREWIPTLYRTLDQEDAFHRGDVYWNAPNGLLSEWHKDCRDEVARFYHGDPSRQQRIHDALKALIKFTDVLVFQRESSLGRCYATNRFLALLLEQYLEQEGKHGSPFRFGRTALHVECGDHAGRDSADPSDHRDGEHQVCFRDTDGVEESVSCRSVVVRCGATIPGPLRKEMLPYWLPDWSPPSRDPKSRSTPPAYLLQTDQAWRAAVWKSLIGTAVLKDNEGRVFAYNPRFAWLIEDKQRAQVIGHRPTEYWNKETGADIERHDRNVRTNGRFLATCEVLRRNGTPLDHHTLRFPLPMGDGTMGSASLGFQKLNGNIETVPSTGQTLPLPSPVELMRFFEHVPLPVTVSDSGHRFVYANSAFCRRLFPGQDLPNALRSIYGNRLNELLPREPRGDDDSENRKNAVWQKKTTEVWTCHPVFGKSLAVGFPVSDDYGTIIGLATVRVPWPAMADVRPDPTTVNFMEIEI